MSIFISNSCVQGCVFHGHHKFKSHAELSEAISRAQFNQKTGKKELHSGQTSITPIVTTSSSLSQPIRKFKPEESVLYAQFRGSIGLKPGSVVNNLRGGPVSNNGLIQEITDTDAKITYFVDPHSLAYFNGVFAGNNGVLCEHTQIVPTDNLRNDEDIEPSKPIRYLSAEETKMYDRCKGNCKVSDGSCFNNLAGGPTITCKDGTRVQKMTNTNTKETFYIVPGTIAILNGLLMGNYGVLCTL